MSITINNEFASTILSAIVSRVPSLAYDYDAQAAPLATPPATVTRRRRRRMCAIERAIRARDLSATVAALA